MDLPVAGELPADRQAAAALSDGGGGTLRTLQRSLLLKAAAGIAQRLAVGQPSPVGFAATESTP